MIISEPPSPVSYVVQIRSNATGDYVDIVVGIESEAQAWEIVTRQRTIRPGALIRAVRRVTRDQVIGEPS